MPEIDQIIIHPPSWVMKNPGHPGLLTSNRGMGTFLFTQYIEGPAAAGLSSIGLQIAFYATRSPVTLGEIV